MWNQNMICRFSMSVAALMLMGRVAWADTSGDLDRFTETAMSQWAVPGVAVAVVQDNKVVWSRGYGIRQAGRPERVDENTTFGIGSVTKSFTATAAAMLVDSGKLNWDSPIIDYLPSLHLYDPWITAHGTVRDLGAHRLGLDGYLAYVAIGGDLDQTLRTARYIVPRTPFRNFQYSNTGYALLGKVIENVSGVSWDDYITEHILKPLDMTHSYSSEYAFMDRANLARCWRCVPKKGTPIGVDALRNPQANFAVPHQVVETSSGGGQQSWQPRVLPWRSERSVVSTGMIYSSVSDMAHYVMLHLADGEFRGQSLVSAAQMRQLHSSQILLPVTDSHHAPAGTSTFDGYGMGWMIGTYRGFAVTHHAGGRVGYGSEVWLFPERKLGIVVLQNVAYSDAALGQSVALRFADHYLGLTDSQTPTRAKEWVPFSARHAECEAPAGDPARVQELAGKYHNDLLGEVEVTAKDGLAAIVFEPESVADLIPGAHDRFTACFRGYEQAPTAGRFTFGADGHASGFLLDSREPGAPATDLSGPEALYFQRENP
jgi:CubicO group peptidase (beta-lactamase class C family)